MGDNTAIEWTEASWNPTRGCSRVSEGCRNCYAETVANRFSGPGQPYEGLISRHGQWNGRITVAEHKLHDPLRWQRPRMIFVDSMSDLFHENIPFEVIDAVFAVMALARQHTFQVLTKRPERMRRYMTGCFERVTHWMAQFVHQGWPSIKQTCDKHGIPFTQPTSAHDWWPLPNVWLGVSVEDQKTANERIPQLLDTPAALRFISAEPLLGPVDISRFVPRGPFYMTRCEHCFWVGSTEHIWLIPMIDDADIECPACRRSIAGDDAPGIDWVIAGGESGPNARPMHPYWVRTLRDQCQAAGVPFFFKQWGEWAPAYFGAQQWEPGIDVTEHAYLDQGPEEPVKVWRCGKKRAGRILDGQEHNEIPEVRR